MAKKNKPTREMIYTDILAKQGVKLKECVVLGYKFPDNAHVEIFHFRIMNCHIETVLFDGMGNTAIMIIKNDFYNPETPGIIRMIAERSGGTEYKPNLKL